MEYFGLSGEGMDGTHKLQHILKKLNRHSLRATCADELALQVFEHVSQEDKLRLSLVCKPWRKLLAESPTLWQTFSGKWPLRACGCILRPHNGFSGSQMQHQSNRSPETVLCTVNPPPKRTLASLSLLLDFLQRCKPCVRQLTFQRKERAWMRGHADV